MLKINKNMENYKQLLDKYRADTYSIKVSMVETMKKMCKEKGGRIDFIKISQPSAGKTNHLYLGINPFSFNHIVDVTTVYVDDADILRIGGKGGDKYEEDYSLAIDGYSTLISIGDMLKTMEEMIYNFNN